MEKTRNKLTPSEEQFFFKLGNELDTQIYYYGSVQRSDYFPKSSDIDVDIFTNNESSTIAKLQNLLGVEKYQFRSFIYKLNKSNIVVRGKKVKYEDTQNGFRTEISIYPEKDKEYVLKDHNYKTVLPFYILYLLIFLKYLYYTFGIITKDTYKYTKRIIMNILFNGKDEEFVITDLKY
jgi:hypothetical protein